MSLIRVSKSVVGKEEAEALANVILKDGYLGMGEEVQSLENDLKGFLQTDKSVVCVNSGTAALHLAVSSVVAPGEEVLVQSLTFVASFQAISGAGAVPVACEVDPKSVTIDLEDAAKRMTGKTRAIMPVHYAGNPGDLESIYQFAQDHKLRVIEDACHSFGSDYKGNLIGAIGDIVCFSFDGIKNITCGEGGALVASDPGVIQYAQDARLLGVMKDTEQRYRGLRSWEFDVMHQGYRYHMSNLLAAVGRVQLKKFTSFKRARQTLAKRYVAALREVEGVSVFDCNYDHTVPHIFAVRVHNNRRDALRAFLIQNEVECGVHYYPNHLLSYYSRPRVALPVTERLYSELLTLPLHPDLSLEQQDKVLKLVAQFLSRGGSQ